MVNITVHGKQYDNEPKYIPLITNVISKHG